MLIELPEGIAKHELNAKPLKAFQRGLESAATDTELEHALNLLSSSKTPVLLIGDGAVRQECDQELKIFLEKTGLYSAHTFMGKGAVTHLYERSLHCVGLGMKDVVIKAFEAADLVICVGYDMVEYPPSRWNVGVPKKIIHINVEAAEVDAHYIPDLELVGNNPAILKALNQKLTSAHHRSNPYLETIQKEIEDDVRSDKADAGFPMKPKRILDDIRNILGDHDLVISDVGAHKMWVARQYGARHSKTCFISNGFCSMGGSLPGAIEAKRLKPSRHVVAICGDGGFMMSIQALATGVQLKLPFVVVLWEDDYYGLIKWKQEMAYHTFSHVHLDNPDLAKLAEACGCHSVAIKKAEEFASELKKALAIKDRPSVIVVPVDYSENMKLFHHLHEKMK